ncbi:HWE histidine kinase domain-containing protein [Falsiroseomonas sp. E2-1-a20]|uniref:GAF domain-containing protein n=1 Tax=Falsiroseomonas sp. E2-1-a20 TaxID=3239300 RepID=UPI003F2B5F58
MIWRRHRFALGVCRSHRIQALSERPNYVEPSDELEVYQPAAWPSGRGGNVGSRTGDKPDSYKELFRQQVVLARFGELALKSHNLDEILNEACRLVGEALSTDLAKVVQLQEDGETLFVRAGVGWKPGVVGHIRLALTDASSEGHALKTGEMTISPNIEEETRFEYAPFLMDNGVKAIANVPIIGGEGRPPFGILQVDSREPRQFTESDILFLRSYANLLAAAVDRLRFLSEIQNANEVLERRVAERTGELSKRTHDLVEANRKLHAEAAERERAQTALHHAQQTGTVVEHLPMGAGLIAPSGQVLVANPEFRRLLPLSIIPSMDYSMGKDWIALHPNGERVEPQDYPGARALRGEVTLNIDFRHWSSSDGERWLRVSGIPVHDDKGGIAAALLVLLDVDEEKRAAERQRFLTRELDHRAKNILAVVQAALRLTKADDMPTFIRAIEGRVSALARAQAILAADRWSSADLRT